ncbi:MFS transporter [Sulfolobus tengchongensis]|uniref:MFS transporter n=1 Tax=Sulfolobus tengchongensis TaxID=207809 RepID=A0AAX4L636_9CREN
MKGLRIIIARVIYAIHWFYLAPLIPYFAIKLNISFRVLGLIPFSFFLGSGIMQVPSAYLSTKIGLRNTLILGLVIMSISPLLVASSSNFIELLIFYLIDGVGASMFFSTGGGILASLNKDSPGLALGIYNTAFAIGGLIGLNWYSAFGKDLSFYILSILTFASLVINISNPNLKPNWKMIRDYKIVILGIALAGIWGVYYAIGELYPSFAYYYMHLSLLNSSLFASLLLASSIIGGSLTFLADRKIRKFKLLIISAILGSIPSLLLYSELYVLGILITGIFNELAISVLYSIIAVLQKGANTTMGLALINSLNILVGMNFEPLASYFGYYMWIVVNVVGLLLFSLILIVRQNISV